MKSFPQSRSLARIGFTLVELLIAMTITLLLMAALAKSFAVIGTSIKEGRSKVTLSSQLRGISFRLRSDLRAATVPAKPTIPSQSGRGYFMYYEGPLTEHTFGLYGAEPTQTTTTGAIVKPGDAGYNTETNSPTYRRHSRFGDFDDYIAFTAEAPGNDWFTGKVPAYLVDDAAADPMEPRVIRSKFAEIIIWASPKWAADPATNNLQLAPHPSAMPLYLDRNVDLVPDEVVLHQRILLIRPDLNVRRVIPSVGSEPSFDADVLRPQGGSTNPDAIPPALQRVYPIGKPNSSTGSPPAQRYPTYALNGSANDNRLMLESNWLVGMTPMHHFFDLSLRRVVNPASGEPTAYVAANSLQDLVQPHNRFAHVRYPGRYFGRGDFSAGDHATSMPLLALGWNDVILSWQGAGDPRANPASATAPAWFPTSHPSPRTFNNAGTGTPADDSLCGVFNGWLLPHFELGDPNPTGSSGGGHWQRGYLETADPRWDRTGEDVFAANILAFDVRAFDKSAPVFMTSGPDGEPGQAGLNDDSEGGSDATFVNGLGQASSELGAVGSDDTLVQISDLAIYDLMGLGILDPSNSATFSVNDQSLASRGAFVDLLYPYLAGSALRQRTNQGRSTGTPTTPAASSIPTVTQVQFNYNSFFQSDFSGFEIAPTVLDSLKRSGKLVHNGTGGAICYMQPTFDTWTDGYETDGFDQTQSADGTMSGSVGTTWVLNDTSGLNRTPRLPTGGTLPVQIDTGQWIPTSPETSPPFAAELPVVGVTIRVGDPNTGEMTQFTVVESMQ